MSVLTTKEAANFMKVSSRQLALLIKEGEIPMECFRVISCKKNPKKKHYRFIEHHLKRWFLNEEAEIPDMAKINPRKLARIA